MLASRCIRFIQALALLLLAAPSARVQLDPLDCNNINLDFFDCLGLVTLGPERTPTILPLFRRLPATEPETTRRTRSTLLAQQP